MSCFLLIYLELTKSSTQLFTVMKVSLDKLKSIGRKRTVVKKPKKVVAKKHHMNLSLGGPSAMERAPLP